MMMWISLFPSLFPTIAYSHLFLCSVFLPHLPPFFFLPVCLKTSRKISCFTFQRMLCCKMDSCSLLPSSLCSCFPLSIRTGLLFISLQQQVKPGLAGRDRELQTFLFSPAVCIGNEQKIKGAELHLSSSPLCLFFCFINSRRILRTWRNCFQGVLMEICIQDVGSRQEAVLFPSVWVQFFFQQRNRRVMPRQRLTKPDGQLSARVVVRWDQQLQLASLSSNDAAAEQKQSQQLWDPVPVQSLQPVFTYTWW